MRILRLATAWQFPGPAHAPIKITCASMWSFNLVSEEVSESPDQDGGQARYEGILHVLLYFEISSGS